jgi:hypothetical protein
VSTVDAFRTQGYLVVPSLVAETTVVALVRHLGKLAGIGIFRSGDTQVPDSPSMYGEPLTEELLEELRPAVERHTGLRLLPTYSYVRLYKHGAVLERHRDRAACEVSVTLSLAADPPEPWPIWIHGFLDTQSVALKPGDALIYRGSDCDHWREAFAGQFAAQVFLHYVDSNGPHTALKFDGRARLNA